MYSLQYCNFTIRNTEMHSSLIFSNNTVGLTSTLIYEAFISVAVLPKNTKLPCISVVPMVKWNYCKLYNCTYALYSYESFGKGIGTK